MKNIHIFCKALFLTIVCISVCLTATACRGENGSIDHLKYQVSAFSASLVGKVNGSEISAVLSVTSKTQNESQDDTEKHIRDHTLTFVSPESLSGIKLACIGGENRVVIGNGEYSEKDIENIGSYVSGWLALAESITFDGEVDKKEKTEDGDETCVTLVRPSGNDSNEYCKITLDCGGDTPIPKHIEAKISGNEIFVSVKNFSFG